MFIGLYDTDNAQHKPQLDPSTTPTGEYLTQEAADAIYAKSADLASKADTSALANLADKDLSNISESAKTVIKEAAQAQ